MLRASNVMQHIVEVDYNLLGIEEVKDVCTDAVSIVDAFVVLPFAGNSTAKQISVVHLVLATVSLSSALTNKILQCSVNCQN